MQKIKSKSKEFFKSILVLLVVFVIMFVVGEMVLRLMVPYDLAAITPDDYLLYRSIPYFEFESTLENFTNHIKLNNYGFNDHHWNATDKKDVRILIVGDSFTEGLAVPFDTHYARVLEKIIDENNKISSDVFAAGVSSWDTSTEVKYLEIEGVSLSPNIVIIQFFMNDVSDVYLKQLFSEKDGVLVDNTPVKIPFLKRIGMELSSKSILIKQATAFLVLNPLGKQITKLLGASSVKETTSTCGYCNVFEKNPPVEVEGGYNITYLLLDEFSTLSKQSNFTAVFMFIPSKEQFSDELWMNFIMNQSDRFERDAPERKISEKMPKEVIIINLMDYFKKDKEVMSYYFETDDHLNSKGNQRAAEIIFEELNKRNLLPKH